jgi:hypothetical protein
MDVGDEGQENALVWAHQVSQREHLQILSENGFGE